MNNTNNLKVFNSSFEMYFNNIEEVSEFFEINIESAIKLYHSKRDLRGFYIDNSQYEEHEPEMEDYFYNFNDEVKYSDINKPLSLLIALIKKHFNNNSSFGLFLKELYNEINSLYIEEMQNMDENELIEIIQNIGEELNSDLYWVTFTNLYKEVLNNNL